MEPHPVTSDSSLMGATTLLGEATAEVAVVASSSPSVFVVEGPSRTHPRKHPGKGSPQADRHFTKKIKIIVSDDESSDIHCEVPELLFLRRLQLDRKMQVIKPFALLI
jgi:hypothetical protein